MSKITRMLFLPNVTRRAILIGCPGQRHFNYLLGVRPDLRNIAEFLCSERGGKFFPNEITVISDATLPQVSEAIHSGAADYTLVYFSGHGYTDMEGHRMLCLQDCSIPDTFLLDQSPRQLIIADACRNYRAGDAIGTISGLSDLYDNFAGSPVRDLFDNWITSSPYGKIIIHATVAGTSAGDTKTGGIFTKSLLSTAQNLFTEWGYAPVAPNYMIAQLCETLNTQIPQIVYSVGDLTVPLVVAKPYERVPAYVTSGGSLQPQASTPGTGAMLFTLGLILVGIALVK
jgi:hypothetical protein